MLNLEEFKLMKLAKQAQEIGESVANRGKEFAEYMLAFAYRIQEEESQRIANRRNIDDLRKDYK